MDSHPVPKNVLTVEFKLFGALSVSQFLKVLGGSLAGLAIFLLPFPAIVRFPLIIIVVGLGIASALIKGFENRMLTIIRAVLVSPQYVWRKDDSVPAVLNQRQKKADDKNKDKKKKSSADDISLDKLLDARTSYRDSQQNQQPVGNDNFSRVYEEIYGASQNLEESTQNRQGAQMVNTSDENLAGANQQQEQIPVGGNTKAGVQTVQNRKPRAPINNPAATQQTQQQTRNQNRTQVPQEQFEPEQWVYGVVVDKKDRPIPNVTVSLFDAANNQVVNPTQSGQDGRFALRIQGVAQGDYVVHLEHGNFQFLDYKISVTGEKLPAYKFRAQN